MSCTFLHSSFSLFRLTLSCNCYLVDFFVPVVFFFVLLVLFLPLFVFFLELDFFLFFFAVFYFFPECQQHVRKSFYTDHGNAVAVLLHEPLAVRSRDQRIFWKPVPAGADQFLAADCPEKKAVFRRVQKSGAEEGRWKWERRTEKILTDFFSCGIVM